MVEKEINLNEYQYELNDSFIAKYPVENRTDSRLLVFDNEITHSRFNDLNNHLPKNSLLVFPKTPSLPE